MQTVHLLGLCGSLRKSSSNDAILRTVAEELLPAQALMEIPSLHDIPLYNEDLDLTESSTPVSVSLLRQMVANADGLLIASPEYNHGMSGVIKNTLDWLSRPHGKSVLKNKPVLIMTASPAVTGGVRAQQQLNETLWAVQAKLVRYPQIVIGSVGEKIRDGRLVDEPARQFLASGVVSLCDTARG